MFARLFLPLVLVQLVATVGCGESESQQELALAEQCVRRSLAAWKATQPPQSLTGVAPSIEFHDDDWKARASLEYFEIVDTYRDTDGHPRCAVKLTTRSADGDPAEQDVTYQVITKPRIVIARDPYS